MGRVFIISRLLERHLFHVAIMVATVFYDKVRPHGQSAAVGARSCISTASWLACALCIVALALLTMTMNSTSGSSSIFKDGRLKPGVYKIQNIQSETYLRGKCVAVPPKTLEKGGGL